MKFTRKLLCVSYLEHRTDEYVRNKVESHVGPREPLRAIVKRWKLICSGHVTGHYSLCKLSSKVAPSIAFVGEGDNVRAGPTTPYLVYIMDTHDNARHLGEGCVASLAWRRTSASSVKGLMMVMTVHLYVALFRICL